MMFIAYVQIVTYTFDPLKKVACDKLFKKKSKKS